jgi:hypothetical protein
MPFMAEKFNLAGLKAECLTAKNSSERDRIRDNSRKKNSIIYLLLIFLMKVLIFLK